MLYEIYNTVANNKHVCKLVLHLTRNLYNSTRARHLLPINYYILVEGNFTASVKAVNKMYLRSAPVTNDISVSPMVPRLTGRYFMI
jgi:hypothetical protein